MTQIEWNEFKSKAIAAYDAIPESGFESYEELKSAFSEVPNTGPHSDFSRNQPGLKLDTSEPDKLKQEIKLAVINNFKAKFGDPPRENGTCYYVGFDSTDVPLFFIEMQHAWPPRWWEKIYTNRNPIVGRSRLQLGFQFSRLNDSLMVRPISALYREHLRRRNKRFFPAVLTITALLFLIGSGLSGVLTMAFLFLPPLIITNFLMKRDGEKHRMSPLDHTLHDPFKLLAWPQGEQFDYWIKPGVIQPWLDDNLQKFEEVVEAALLSNHSIDSRIERRPPPPREA